MTWFRCGWLIWISTAPFASTPWRNVTDHEVLATFACKEWAESIINWLKERHGWERFVLKICWRLPQHCPRTGIYHPLFHGKGIRWWSCLCISSFLSCDAEERTWSGLVRWYWNDGQYHIDFDRFHQRCAGIRNCTYSGNPIIRADVYGPKKNCHQIADICYEHIAIVISDEIHADSLPRPDIPLCFDFGKLDELPCLYVSEQSV